MGSAGRCVHCRYSGRSLCILIISIEGWVADVVPPRKYDIVHGKRSRDSDCWAERVGGLHGKVKRSDCPKFLAAVSRF